MAIIKSFTSLEQSKKLAEILPLKSADMAYYFMRDSGTLVNPSPFVLDGTEVREDGMFTYLNCWSLAALRNLLPPAIKPNKNSYLFLFESHNTFDKSWVYRYYNEDDISYLYYKNTSEVDACVAMIEKLYELKML